MNITDVKDFADAIAKVIENINKLKNSSICDGEGELFDAVKAIDKNVSAD